MFPARPYDPELGRFLQPDPFVQDPADPQSLNRYSYVRNNPVNLVDPSGYFWQFIVAAIAAVFVVAAVVSVIASAISLIASATGHERTAMRAAKIAVVSAQVAMVASATFSIFTGGAGSETMGVATQVAMLAHFSMSVAQASVSEASGNSSSSSFAGAVAKGFANTAAEYTPGVSEAFDLRVAIAGVNPFTQETLTPFQRAATGAVALAQIALKFFANSASGFVRQLNKAIGKRGGGRPTIKPGSVGGPTAGQRFPERVRKQAFEDDPTQTCVYCGRPTATQVDHAKARAKGGNATLENAQLACSHCNPSKGSRDFPVTPPSDYEGPWPPPWWPEQQ